MAGDFDHFLEAQDPIYGTVVLELTAGEKRTLELLGLPVTS
jgi:uncharacterized protein (DUF1810 family)